MPRFEQTQDGNYIIISHAKGQFVTYQLHGVGVTFLNQHGVNLGEIFPPKLLYEMIQRNFVFTNGSGIQKNLHQPVNRTVNICTEIHSENKIAGRITTIAFARSKGSWNLSIVLPQFPPAWIEKYASQHLLMELKGCQLSIVGASKHLPVTELLLSRRETALTVIPLDKSYTVKPLGKWPAYLNLKDWIQDIKGLNPLGTFFKKNRTCTRLYIGEAIFPGNAYYVALHKSRMSRVKPPIKKVKIVYLGQNSMWEAWELDLPNVLDASVRNWCNSLGYPINGQTRQ